MKRSALTVAFLMPLIITLTIGVRTIHAQPAELKDCQKHIGPGTTCYSCQVQTSDSSTLFSDSARVHTSTGDIFTITELLGAYFACECKAAEKARPGAVKFGTSDTEFICAGSDDGTIGLQGKIEQNGDKIVGQGVVRTKGEFSFIYSCTRTTSCPE